MDNLGELGALLTPLLSNPETMNSLRQAAEQMGLGGLLPESSETGFDENREATEQAQRKVSVGDKGESMGDLFSAVTKLAPRTRRTASSPRKRYAASVSHGAP